MLLSAKRLAFGGLLLAMTEVCMLLGSVIETNTLFLLAAAAFFVGIVIREFGIGTGVAFYGAGVLLGFFLSPNKFYVFSYAAMGLYILLVELIWLLLGKLPESYHRISYFWIAKFIVFNAIYNPLLLLFGDLLLTKSMTPMLWIVLFVIGQIGLMIYDRAYDYVQSQVWGKLRNRLLN